MKLNVKIIVNNSQDGAEDGSRVACSGKICSFSYVLFVFLLFYVLDVVSITVYDRDTLLNIGSSVAQRKPDFEFLNAGGLFTDVVRASHTNEKQGTAALFASQKPGCLLLFQTQPSSSRASPCTAQIEQRSSQGKAEAGVFVSILTTCGVMKGTYTLLNPSAPLIWNFIRFCVDHSGYRENLQPS